MTKPKYSIWEAINIALALSSKAMELARVPGPAGRDGTDGKDGVDGRDGTDGKNGADGKDGADAILYDDWNEWQEDEGRVMVRAYYLKGEEVKVFRHTTRAMIWRGVFDSNRTYLPGDVATWKGSLWHCNKEVTGKIGSDHWSLAVKAGRDGKDGGQS